MASNKQGFNYFNIDTDRYQDSRIKRLKKTLGCVGLSVYDYILCEIYRVKGCFIVWDESTAFDVADYLEIKETVVQEVVNYCCNVGLFNKELRASENVLSSGSIQRRFLEMSIRAKRKKFIIPEKYCLIQEESNIIQEESNIIQEKNAQIPQRVKESKVKERRVEESISAPPDFFSKNIKERKAFFKSILKPFEQKYGYEMMNEFYKYWTQIAKPDRMYFEVQNDFYPNIRLENWKRVGAKSMQHPVIDGPKMKEL